MCLNRIAGAGFGNNTGAPSGVPIVKMEAAVGTEADGLSVPFENAEREFEAEMLTCQINYLREIERVIFYFFTVP